MAAIVTTFATSNLSLTLKHFCKKIFFQIAIATSVGEVITRLKVDPAFDQDYETIFSQVGKILATLLTVPKSSQLRTKSLEVTQQVLDVFISCERPEIIYLFKIEIAQSVEDVIKDLGCEAAAKDAARDLKAAMADIVDNSPPQLTEDEDVVMQ